MTCRKKDEKREILSHSPDNKINLIVESWRVVAKHNSRRQSSQRRRKRPTNQQVEERIVSATNGMNTAKKSPGRVHKNSDDNDGWMPDKMAVLTDPTRWTAGGRRTVNRVENSIDHEVNQGPREVVDSKIVIIHFNGVKAWLDFTTKLAQLTLLYASKRGETICHQS